MLKYRTTDDSNDDVIVPADNLFYKRYHTPISGVSNLVKASYTPRRPTNVYQSDSSTYLKDSITLHWTAPVDDGCADIISYKIEAEIDSSWVEVGASTGFVGVADLSAQIGILTSLRVTADNHNGFGEPSEVI
jgi:hypothetical protein